MRVAVIGGGPAGLYFAILLKRDRPGAHITVVERNRPDDTFGFGVVFSDQTLDTFAAADMPSYRAIVENFAYWDDIEIHVRGTVHRIGGNGFCGCSRRSLLMLLHERARALGVELLFNQEATPEDFPDADLIVAADGINSAIRTRSEAHFQPHTDLRPNRFAWMGSTRPFDAFTFFFKERPEGIFIAHCYQYEPGASTWVLEMEPETFARAGPGPGDRGGVRAVHGGRLRRGTRGPQADHQPQPLAAVPDDPLRPVDSRATSCCWGTRRRPRISRSGPAPSWRWRTRSRCMRRSWRAGRWRTGWRDSSRAARRGGENPARGGRLAGVVRARAAVLADASHAVRVRRDDAVEGDHLRRPGAAGAGFRAGRWMRCSRGRLPATANRRSDRPPMFQPFRLRGMPLANRVVVSPMCQYSAEDGMPTDWHLVHYGARATGGAGLVYTEMICPSADARITPGCAGLWNDAQEAAWTRIVGFAHAHGAAKMCLQLGHAGRKGSTRLMWDGMDRPLQEGGWPIISASAIPYYPDSQVPRAMDRADMDRVVDDFRQAAERGERCGFDMLELHCAHGYLLASFLSPLTNTRTDEYGGPVENRLRFPLEVFDALRKIWPAEKPMSVRLSATDWADGGISEADVVAIARAFAAHGCDLMDVSTGQTVADAAPVYGRMFQVPFSDMIRNETGVATMCVGSITSADQVNTILAAGRADLVALGSAASGGPGVRHAGGGRLRRDRYRLPGAIRIRPGRADAQCRSRPGGSDGPAPAREAAQPWNRVGGDRPAHAM